MTDRNLEGKVVVMTGRARHGQGNVHALAGAGAKVAMIDIDKDVLNEAAKLAENAGGQRRPRASFVMLRMLGTQATAEEIVATFGSLDVLVNDAVIGPERISGFMTKKSSSGNWTTICGTPCCG